MNTQGGLMVMAGGTGGHVFPALAVAKALQAKGINVRWMGTRRGLEARVVPDADIPIDWITIEGLRGKNKLSLVLAPFKLLRAFWQSIRILHRHKPDLVLGMGGFVAGPGGVAARALALPLLVHEQNAVAGLTNRYLAKIATRVLTGFPKVVDLPEGSEWVGNPVRSDIAADLSDRAETNKHSVRVLVVGGSQGALSFNRHLPDLFARAATELSNSKGLGLEVWHQTGRGRHEAVEAAYISLSSESLDFQVSEFITDMSKALSWADLVVCRAGAMTIAELCAAAKASVLIPYPFSAGDHQDRNAEYLVNVGAARLVQDTELTGDTLLNTLTDVFEDLESLEVMGHKAHELHKPNALHDVVAVCEELIDA